MDRPRYATVAGLQRRRRQRPTFASVGSPGAAVSPNSVDDLAGVLGGVRILSPPQHAHHYYDRRRRTQQVSFVCRTIIPHDDVSRRRRSSEAGSGFGAATSAWLAGPRQILKPRLYPPPSCSRRSACRGLPSCRSSGAWLPGDRGVDTFPGNANDAAHASKNSRHHDFAGGETYR